MADEYGEIAAMLRIYCDALYACDATALRGIFHPQSVLFTTIEGVPPFQERDDWLSIVAARESPEYLGEAWDFEIVEIDVTERVAMAQVRCRMFGYNYSDYLSLVYVDEKWVIATKTFERLPI